MLHISLICKHKLIVLSIFHYVFKFLCHLLPHDGVDIFDELLFLFGEVILFVLSLPGEEDVVTLVGKSQ